MNPIATAVEAFSSSARARRVGIFRDTFRLDKNTIIQDLGSEDGLNIHNVLENTSIENDHVYIADIDEAALESGQKKYGFNPILIEESKRLPFPDHFFDIVYCSSVIEHVTIPKSEIWIVLSGKKFKARARKRQRTFASEIRRLGKQYFVQTPYKHFLLESHTWLPFVGWLPRRLSVRCISITNRFWVKKTSPDWHLLDKTELSELFPDSEIVEEKVIGLTKSIMAVRSAGNQAFSTASLQNKEDSSEHAESRKTSTSETLKA